MKNSQPIPIGKDDSAEKRFISQVRVKAIIELSKFILPTLKATEMSLSNETKFQAIEIELK